MMRLMTVVIETKEENHAWIVGRISGVISAIADNGSAFTTKSGYAMEMIERSEEEGGGWRYVLRNEVSGKEFKKIRKMLDSCYGDGKLCNITVECGWH